MFLCDANQCRDVLGKAETRMGYLCPKCQQKVGCWYNSCTYHDMSISYLQAMANALNNGL